MIKVIDSDNDVELNKINAFSVDIAECFSQYFHDSSIYVINELDGEDHIYVQDRDGHSSFDMIVTKARKFVFLWYHTAFSDGPIMIREMCDIVLRNGFDFAVKCPLLPSGRGLADISRVGRVNIGDFEVMMSRLNNFKINDNFFDYRIYDWFNDEHCLSDILISTNAWMGEASKSFSRNEQYANFTPGNSKGTILYAGCAFAYVFPNLGFGMRDIDVNVFYPMSQKTPPCVGPYRKGVNCQIDSFGKPKYCDDKTRILDVYWNRFHSDTGDFADDVLYYINDMRTKSDRWSTIIHRPIIDLTTEKVIYIPNWLKKIKEIL